MATPVSPEFRNLDDLELEYKHDDTVLYLIREIRRGNHRAILRGVSDVTYEENMGRMCDQITEAKDILETISEKIHTLEDIMLDMERMRDDLDVECI